MSKSGRTLAPEFYRFDDAEIVELKKRIAELEAENILLRGIVQAARARAKKRGKARRK